MGQVQGEHSPELLLALLAVGLNSDSADGIAGAVEAVVGSWRVREVVSLPLGFKAVMSLGESPEYFARELTHLLHSIN